MTLPPWTLELLPEALPGGAAIGAGADWDWMWTPEAPPPQPREDQVVRLPADGEHDRLIDALLDGAVTAAATRAVLAVGAPVCTLGTYADNRPARRVYARLGYRCEHRFSSRALVR